MIYKLDNSYCRFTFDQCAFIGAGNRAKVRLLADERPQRGTQDAYYTEPKMIWESSSPRSRRHEFSPAFKRRERFIPIRVA